MLKELFSNRLFIGALAFFILCVVGGTLYISHVEKQGTEELATDEDPVKQGTEKQQQQPTAKAPVAEQTPQGHFHADGTWHSEPHETPVAVSDISAPLAAPVEFADGVNPTSTSSNPLFADGVPEHLQCPPDLIDVYARDVSKQRIQELQRIGVEIIEKWNPNRPLTEVYPAFIEAEKWYHDNADPEREGNGWGAKRMDWQFQIVLDFPEIGVLAQEDSRRSMIMWRVELGDWPADLNVMHLPDGSGRTFRTDDDKKYVFTSSTYTEKPDGDGFTSTTSTVTTGPSNGDPNAEVIEIDLDTISDEELEALQGWDYTINPYTTGIYKLGDKK